MDLFDQDNLLNTQAAITLAQSQTLSPLPQAYFILYEIGEKAIQGNKVGVMMRDRSYITVNAPHDISVNIYVGVTKLQPKGTYTDTYPYNSSLVPITAVSLALGGVTVAPRATGQGVSNVPMLTLRLNTLSDYVAVGGITFRQTGTISTTTALLGEGDLAALDLWMDNGDGAFSPINDTRIGHAVHSATSSFKTGVTVSMSYGNLPYLVVSSRTVILHLACDISTSTDLSGANTMGHLAGLSIDSFSSLLAPNGQGLSVAQYYADVYPVESGQTLIAPAVIPLTPAYKSIMLAANGYPAYALLDGNGAVVMGPGNVPVANPARWIYNYPGMPCKPEEPLIDINGDGRPDNFDYYGMGKCLNITLNNSGAPAFDIDGDRLLDFESNLDYVPDLILDDGTGRPLYFTGDNVQNTRMQLAVPELGALPSAWSSKATALPARWNPASGAVASYEVTLSGNYSDPSALKGGWQPVGLTLAGTLTGVALSPGNLTRLTSRIDVNSTQFTVANAAAFSGEGVLYVGNEIMTVTKLNDTTFKIDGRGVQGSFAGPHTAWGETVSDRAYVLSVRGLMADGRYVPSESGVPTLIYRIDVTNPSKPGAPEPQVSKGLASGQAYTLKWSASEDVESNIMSYEIQEREGVSPVWRTVAGVPGFKMGGAVNNIYTVGDPSTPGETARPLGKYYTYRVRSWNYAGIPSDWSDVSTPAGTTIGTELISKVSNFPNPVDTRKGGVEGMTKITYELNDNAEVTITLYDLLGYVVREYKFSNGSQGGKLGPNFVLWDGKNALGGYVSKGGYIVRVKASSPKGSKIITRKIGVIH